MIGDKQAVVKFSNETLLIVESPSLKPASYPLTIPNSNIGNLKYI